MKVSDPATPAAPPAESSSRRASCPTGSLSTGLPAASAARQAARYSRAPSHSAAQPFGSVNPALAPAVAVQPGWQHEQVQARVVNELGSGQGVRAAVSVGGDGRVDPIEPSARLVVAFVLVWCEVDREGAAIADLGSGPCQDLVNVRVAYVPGFLLVAAFVLGHVVQAIAPRPERHLEDRIVWRGRPHDGP